jgi:RNA polymerase sigma-70 factor (ECF subfamily)
MVMDAWAETSDEELLLEIGTTAAVDRAHAAELFEELVRRFSGVIHLVTWNILQNSDDAEEASQDTLLQVWRHAGTFSGGVKAITWIWPIAKNAALNIYRRKLSKHRRRFVNRDPFVFDRCPDRPSPPAADEERAVLLHAAVANLPQKYRSVVEILDLCELKYEVAATRLHIPIGTVRSRRHRALKLLRELLPPPTP